MDKRGARLGKQKPANDPTTLTVAYPHKKNVAFQLISKQDKTLAYPNFATSEESFTFQADKQGEYTLLGVKYLRNKVQICMQTIKMQDNQLEINELNFSDYDTMRDAKRALRVLDY